MSADRRHARQEALVGLLEAEGLDALLVTSLPNIRYLTGFSGSAGLAVLTRADALRVTDFRYDEQARAEAGAVARVEVERTSVWERLFKALATLGPLERVGYEPHALTVKDAERLSQAGRPGDGAPRASSSSGCASARTPPRSPRFARPRRSRGKHSGSPFESCGPDSRSSRSPDRWSGTCGGWAARGTRSPRSSRRARARRCRTRRRARGEWRPGSGCC